MTHKDLENRAERWLKHTIKCKLVLMDYYARIHERPDALGWKADTSYLIECKASRSDFIRDKKKKSRKGDAGMGNLRFYMAPPGIIKPEDLPPKWGLVEVYPTRTVLKVRAQRFNSSVNMLRNERFVLMHALARALSVDPTCIDVGKLQAKADFLEYKLNRKRRVKRHGKSKTT